MALSNLSGWAGSAYGAADKLAEKPTACGAGEKPTACGSACGAGEKPTACGAGDK